MTAHACEDVLRLAESGGGPDPAELDGGPDPAELDRVLGQCMAAVASCDLILLACTDFTCVGPAMHRVNHDAVGFPDPAAAVVSELATLLAGLSLVRLHHTPEPRNRFCATGPDPSFTGIGRDVFGLPIAAIERVRV